MAGAPRCRFSSPARACNTAERSDCLPQWCACLVQGKGTRPPSRTAQHPSCSAWHALQPEVDTSGGRCRPECVSTDVPQAQWDLITRTASVSGELLRMDAKTKTMDVNIDLGVIVSVSSNTSPPPAARNIPPAISARTRPSPLPACLARWQ